jgi:hypothetical protein
VTVLTVATCLLVVIAAVAAYYVARGTVAIVQIHRQVRDQQTLIYKHMKGVLRDTQKLNGTAHRILDRQYEFARQAELVLMDPKVQAALNKSQRETHGR